MKKKILISSICIITTVMVVLFTVVPSSSAATTEDYYSDLTVTQPWDYTPGASYYEYWTQSGSQYPVQPDTPHYVNFPAPTSADSPFGAGNYHFAGPYVRMGSLKFHAQASDPRFTSYGFSKYKYKYNCEMHFFMGAYSKDGVINCYVTVGIKNGESGVTETLNFDCYNIWDTTSSSRGMYMEDGGKFVVNFSQMFSQDYFDENHYVQWVEVLFAWNNITSNNSSTFTAFIPQQSYVPHFDSPSDAPVYVAPSEDPINGLGDANDYLNDNIYNNLDSFSNWFGQVIESFSEFNVELSFAKGVLTNLFNQFNFLLVPSICIGSFSLLFFSLQFISKRR